MDGAIGSTLTIDSIPSQVKSDLMPYSFPQPASLVRLKVSGKSGVVHCEAMRHTRHLTWLS
tara:strand:- start:23 stop:205 length:183 start_codon:yes stop_codon:yes gene_type:complete